MANPYRKYSNMFSSNIKLRSSIEFPDKVRIRRAFIIVSHSRPDYKKSDILKSGLVYTDAKTFIEKYTPILKNLRLFYPDASLITYSYYTRNRRKFNFVRRLTKKSIYYNSKR
jgi:hypothetical protein